MRHWICAVTLSAVASVAAAQPADRAPVHQRPSRPEAAHTPAPSTARAAAPGPPRGSFTASPARIVGFSRPVDGPARQGVWTAGPSPQPRWTRNAPDLAPAGGRVSDMVIGRSAELERDGGARGFGRPYVYPRGASYHAWRRGDRFPHALLISEYILNDYAYYDLAPPPQAWCEWVRYGPDAVLIDTDTGQVVDVAYGVFTTSPDGDERLADGPDASGYPYPDGPGVVRQGYPYGRRSSSDQPPAAPYAPYPN